MSDPIWREDAINALYHHFPSMTMRECAMVLHEVPPAQLEPAIPLSWIEAQIEWLKSLNNAFSALTAEQIFAIVNKWKDEQDG